MVERGGELSLARHGLLRIGRASPYREPAGESESNLALMRCLDELYVACPFHGSGRWRGTCGARGRSRVGTAFAG